MKKMILGTVSALTLAAMALPALATCYGQYCGGGQNGSGSAWFSGGVLGENQTGAQGGLTMTGSWLEKAESGYANVIQNSNGPDSANAGASVLVTGGGFAKSLNGNWGSSMSMTGVLGIVQGEVAAGTGN